MKVMFKSRIKVRIRIGDIQTDDHDEKVQWVVIGVTHLGISRVKRDSLAHLVHAQSSPDIAKSLTLPIE